MDVHAPPVPVCSAAAADPRSPRGSGRRRGCAACRVGLAILCALLLSPAGARPAEGAPRSAWVVNPHTGETSRFPQLGPNQRPYSVLFTSMEDGVQDEYGICLPADFDPARSYPVWIRFLPYTGSLTGIYHPSFARHYCDESQVIFIGFSGRGGRNGTGVEFLGDNPDHGSWPGEMIRDDLRELMNELKRLFRVRYFALTGSSMGGYSALRAAVAIPRDELGVVVASCPGIFYRNWVTGQGLIEDRLIDGWFDDRLVILMHGIADDTVSISSSDRLDRNVPDRTWWQYHRVPGAGHWEFFMRMAGDEQQWGLVDPTIDDEDPRHVWHRVQEWEDAHPELAGEAPLAPAAGWSEPAATDGWYVPQSLVVWALERQGDLPPPSPRNDNDDGGGCALVSSAGEAVLPECWPGLTALAALLLAAGLRRWSRRRSRGRS